jgi:shikimate 5-dehydrogenase
MGDTDLRGRMEIRYAVAGKPIQHSLSPVLAVLTATHLKQAGLEIEFEEINLLESDDVTSPMAWAWVKKNRQSIDLSNRLYGNPSTPSSHSKLHRIASTVMSQVKTADSSYVPHGETLFHQAEERIKVRRGDRESWISLTSPLKHLLSTRSGVNPIDDSLENGAVNQLRWDGKNWYCAGTDGSGLVAIARHFGFNFELTGVESPLLCMVGGGGSARSCATAWSNAGGSIWSIEGRRPLGKRGPWVQNLISGDQVVDNIGMRLFIDFDTAPGVSESNRTTDCDLHLLSSYNSKEVGLIVEPTDSGLRLDARWLLAAQHLEAWARIFSPEAAHLLPGLGLTMTRLQAMESALRAD